MLMTNGIFNKSGIPLYQRLLKVVSVAQKSTAANIANVTTPGYQAQGVDFKEEMRKSIAGHQHVRPVATDSRHWSAAGSKETVKIKELGGEGNASGVNDVDIEKQMANLAGNEMMYEFGAKKLAGTFGLLKMAIRGRSQ